MKKSIVSLFICILLSFVFTVSSSAEINIETRCRVISNINSFNTDSNDAIEKYSDEDDSTTKNSSNERFHHLFFTISKGFWKLFIDRYFSCSFSF